MSEPEDIAALKKALTATIQERNDLRHDVDVLRNNLDKTTKEIGNLLAAHTSRRLKLRTKRGWDEGGWDSSAATPYDAD